MAAATFAFEQLEPRGEVVGGAAGAATQAARIVQAAHLDAAAVRARAEVEGREAGFAAGLEAGMAELELAREALASAALGVEAATDAFVAVAERRAVELAVALAEKVVGAAIAADPDRVLTVVAGALRRAAARDEVVLDVHPDDADAVRAAVTDVAGRLGGIRRIEVVAERRVARGGCVVRTREGEVDATVDGQLERAREAMLRELQAAGG